MNDKDLVYSTETKGENLKKKTKSKNSKLVEIDPATTRLKLQFEKKGRGGKGVTVVMGLDEALPENPPYFKRLMKDIKAQLATGGAFKETAEGCQLEFQGNRLEEVREILQVKGFAVKG